MFLTKRFDEFRDKIAIIDEDNQNYSYKHLKQKINFFSKKIEKKRSLCFILCQNDFSTIIAYLSFLNSKSVIALIDQNIKIKSLKGLVYLYEPDYIFGNSIINKLKLKNYSKLKLQKGKYLFESKKKNAQNRFHKDLCMLISTSGTTGSPKLVKLSYLNLESNTVSISKYLNIKTNDTTITTLPMSYVYGLSILNTHLYSGGTVVLNNKSIIQNDFWEKLNHIKLLILCPYLYKLILKLKQLNNLTYLKHSLLLEEIRGKNLIILNNI